MIHIILGTRAQLIKMAPILVELQNRKIDYNFIFLAEHKETMNSMLEMFGIKKPDMILGNLNKDINKVSTIIFWSLKILINTLLYRRRIFKNYNRNSDKEIVLVHGDAPPALLGALMGKIAGLKIGHVESGLRSYNLFNPFPEEIIRILTFKIADYYFCPGDWAMKNLQKKNGIKINTAENTLLDSLKLAIKNENKINVDIPKEKYCIATIHRFENIFNKDKLEKVIKIIEEISGKIKVIFILHPPTKEKLEKFDFMKRLIANENIKLRPRYDYFKFIKLVNNSEFVISDGGSNQEESYYIGKPCLLLRYKTERKEGIDHNVILSEFKIEVIRKFVENYKEYKRRPIIDNISPSKIIVDSLIKITAKD